MEMFYKLFTSKEEMVQQVSELSPLLDTQAMTTFKGHPRSYYVVNTDGEVFSCNTFKKFMSIISCVGELDFVYPVCTDLGGAHFNVYSKVDYFNTELPSTVIEEDAVEEEIVVEEVNPTIEHNVDWDMINGLVNKKFDKIALDDYASAEFGIKLNQRNTLENMIVDFKAQLANKE